MTQIIYLKKVKSHGDSGYAVFKRDHCPTGKIICVAADGESYCPWLDGCSLYNKIDEKFFLMSCTEPEGKKND